MANETRSTGAILIGYRTALSIIKAFTSGTEHAGKQNEFVHRAYKAHGASAAYVLSPRKAFSPVYSLHSLSHGPNLSGRQVGV